MSKINWHLMARRLARKLDEAITIPGAVMEDTLWSHNADALIKACGIKPGSSIKRKGRYE